MRKCCVRISLYRFTSWNPSVPSKFIKAYPNLINHVVPVGVPIYLALRYTWTFMSTCRDFFVGGNCKEIALDPLGTYHSENPVDVKKYVVRLPMTFSGAPGNNHSEKPIDVYN